MVSGEQPSRCIEAQRLRACRCHEGAALDVAFVPGWSLLVDTQLIVAERDDRWRRS
jgi:hypothetical protein